jgi:3-methyladenine DNA glycosylase Tag
MIRSGVYRCTTIAGLFEFLILEGAQACLTWQTVLNKCENYRRAFDGFHADKIACYGKEDVNRLLTDAGTFLGNGKTLILFDSLWIDYKFEFFIIVL